MRLADWLKETKTPQARIAELLDISAPVAMRIVRCMQEPTFAQADKIEKFKIGRAHV